MSDQTAQLHAINADLAELSDHIERVDALLDERSNMFATNDQSLSDYIGSLYALIGDLTERVGRLEKEMYGSGRIASILRRL